MNLLNILAAASWSSFFGHFHPVMVHLPIGMLIIAAMLELLAVRSRTTQLDKAISLILFCGFITAVISALAGWLLSQDGGYNDHTLLLHQWAGICVAVLAGSCWYLKTKNIKYAYRIVMFIMLLMLTAAGHLGGTLTHGDGYLTSNLPEPLRSWLGAGSAPTSTAPKKITDVNEAIIYTDIISPILQSKCLSCHGESKSKGDLRMDTYDMLMKGGKHGMVVVKNNAGGSELVKRLLLPAEDEHRMPPKGKTEVTPDEIALIKWWIINGADFSKKVKDAKTDELTRQLLVKGIGNTSQAHQTYSTANTHTPDIFAADVPPAEQGDIDALKKLSVLVYPISQGKNYLSVSCINAPGFNDEQVKLLVKLDRQIAWLQLNGTRVTDIGLAEIAKLKNLTRLNLAYTAVSNNGIRSICKLSNLEYLNLSGTLVDNGSLKPLESLKHLKHVYDWKDAAKP